MWDFLGGPVAKTAFPMQGAWVQSLVRELDPTCQKSCMPQLGAAKLKTQKPCVELIQEGEGLPRWASG